MTSSEFRILMDAIGFAVVMKRYEIAHLKLMSVRNITQTLFDIRDISQSEYECRLKEISQLWCSMELKKLKEEA